MTRTKVKSKNAKPKANSTDLADIWAAAAHVAQQRKAGLLTPAIRAGLSPFMTAAVDLALATTLEPGEGVEAILAKARISLEEAKRVLPSIEGHLKKQLSQEVTQRWQKALARYAVTTLREFPSHVDPTASQPQSAEDYEPYATTPAAQLEEPNPSRLWMVEHLWQRSGTGLIGGPPKSGKTWFALDIALSLASGTKALDTFEVHRPGNVIYVCAEGGEAYMKQRLTTLCVHRGLSLDSLPHRLDIIPRVIRIDTPDGFCRLRATVKALAPTLLVLDPLVRLHRLDENSASSVSGLLSNLTELQQDHDLAIIIVHHTTKHRGKNPSGQDFRGSSDFYAWGDSNIVTQKGGQGKFVISAEHRAAPAREKWTLQATEGEHSRLEVVDGDPEDSPDENREADDQRISGDILDLVRRHGAKSKTELRRQVKGRNDRVGKAVDRLAAEGKLVLTKEGWAPAKTNGKVHAPVPS